MSKLNWRNGFAVGLTAGICLATLVILSGQVIYDLARCGCNAQRSRHSAQYEGKDFPSSWWWRWTGDLVSSGDTFAQWIMVFFTIAAVLLVWRTFVATQEMAVDTREIGQAQARAYFRVNIGDMTQESLTRVDGSNVKYPLILKCITLGTPRPPDS
jgi:hypothetical protein